MKTCLDCGIPKSRKGNYCKSCGYKYRTRPNGLKYKIVTVNKGWFKKGFIPHNFSGDLVGYGGLHDWVEYYLGKSKEKQCEFCGSKKSVQWANKSKKYLRDLSDWIALCRPCHHQFDDISTKIWATRRLYG